MKKINITTFLPAVAGALLAGQIYSSCSKDVPIEGMIDVNAGYTLPQSGASDEDNARIMDIYEKWSSYVLYDLDSTDVYWKQIAGTAHGGGTVYVFKEGDPKYVGDMLDYLDDIWWKYFPDEFLRSGGIPFRVYIVEEYYYYRDWGSSGVSPNTYLDYMINENSIIVSGMSKVANLDAASKKKKQLTLISALFSDWQTKGKIKVPSEFYTISDYTTKPEMSTEADQYGYPTYVFNEQQLDAWRNRGFIPSITENPTGTITVSEIYSKYSATSDNWDYSDPKQLDFDAYISQILRATDDEVEELMQYETVKTKWNIITDFYKENYGIDLRAIATK